MPASPSYNSLPAFHAKLVSTERILAICGAGLSAASGLPTFRGAGGLWRNHEATSLATPEAFDEDPGLVWLFYGYRRHMALNARPNSGHYALAALAKKHDGFLCLSQNVDGLHVRAGHEDDKLRLLHGSLFDIKCSNYGCDWVERVNTDDPFVPALKLASEEGEELSRLLDPESPLAAIDEKEIPRCPSCQVGLQRPGVVWFGEPLDEEMLDGVEAWIEEGEIGIVLVIGTSAVVHPAAGYAERARGRNTSVVTVNLEEETPAILRKMKKNDFYFAGDAAELLPKLLEPVIGKPNGEGRWE
ncbi:hypothetical protein OQA88_10143 [Cercophora sp. LCS_1]